VILDKLNRKQKISNKFKNKKVKTKCETFYSFNYHSNNRKKNILTRNPYIYKTWDLNNSTNYATIIRGYALFVCQKKIVFLE
jgi:hypothetical protein